MKALPKDVITQWVSEGEKATDVSLCQLAVFSVSFSVVNVTALKNRSDWTVLRSYHRKHLKACFKFVILIPFPSLQVTELRGQHRQTLAAIPLPQGRGHRLPRLLKCICPPP